MPMSGSVLSAAIKAALSAEGFELGNAPQTEKFVDVIAEQVVNHIQTQALVTTTVAVASVSGVTTGPGVSGPGTGTGTGAIK